MLDPTNPEFEPGYDPADIEAEVLSALKELLFRVNRNDQWIKHCNPSEAAMRQGVVNRARAAIAKAEGGETT